ncbi:MAG: hypothetical protein WC710_13490 [Gallionella sp.]|jgi:hypothetical protein
MNDIICSWHAWRAAVAARKLSAQQALCDLLEKAESEYGSSYYTDRWHDAVCKRIQLASAFEYHSAKARKP